MEPITTIVHFSMPRENMDEFLRMWADRQEVMVGQPGAIDNVLHRTIDDDSPFQFINVAHWESADALALGLKATAVAAEKSGVDIRQEFARLGVTMSQNNYREIVSHEAAR